jgi:hypothetical protein
MIDAIRAYLDAALYSDAPSLRALAAALDGLATAYNLAPEGDVTDTEADAPSTDAIAIGRLVSERFPTFGFYALANPLNPLQDTPLCGDAVDDTEEIASDLMEVVWLWENVGPDDAHWQFRWGYENHWGEHLRDLQRYLYAQLFRT